MVVVSGVVNSGLQIQRRSRTTFPAVRLMASLVTSTIAQRRALSSSSHGGRERLGRTLYRQLLRWSQDTDNRIPLSDMVPPVTLHPPRAVSARGLQRLAAVAAAQNDNEVVDDAEFRRIFGLLPPRSNVEAHRILVPIHRASHVGQLFRVIFRLNLLGDTDISKEEFNERTSLAFEALKSLNELTGGLDDMKAQRSKHLDREGVTYRVGQVVQHKNERWRGVVVGWRHVEESDISDGPTSLTTKVYDHNEALSSDDLLIPKEKQVPSMEQNQVEYKIMWDSGDASLLGGKRPRGDVTSMPTAMQSELELVKDKCLLRVRSHWVPFDHFDPVRMHFTPNEALAYEYPLDLEERNEKDSCKNEAEVSRNELGDRVVAAIQEFAARLERCVSEESQGYILLTRLHDRLSDLAKGDVMSPRDALSSREPSSFNRAVFHLKGLFSVAAELADLLRARRIAESNQDRVRFKIGDIVQHIKYGFRGVVVAWDPTPSVDVSRWDGLVGIENVSELPFYHVIPDQNDCVEAFGGERAFRYICEANLEACPKHRTILNVELDTEWEWNNSEARYTPPDDIKFRYAEDIGDEGATLSCFKWMVTEITRLELAIRDPPLEGEWALTDMAKKLSMDTILEMLRLSNSMEEASVVEEAVKTLWLVHKEPELRNQLDDGIALLLNGNKEKALVIFNDLVGKDPTYAEAWNKVSTCQFMLGNMQSALEATERTLVLEPLHFQARSGLGLVQYETRRYSLAVDSFRQALAINPWSPISSRLAACLDMVFDDDGANEEEDSEEGTAPYQTKPS